MLRPFDLSQDRPFGWAQDRLVEACGEFIEPGERRVFQQPFKP